MSSEPAQHNGWSVLALVVEGVFGLLSSNRLYPAFGMLFFLLAGMVVWRVPESDLAVLVKFGMELIATTSGGLFALLIFSNVGWAALYARSSTLYKLEIARLSASGSSATSATLLCRQTRRRDDIRGREPVLASRNDHNDELLGDENDLSI